MAGPATGAGAGVRFCGPWGHRGAVHAFRNDSGEPASMLMLVAPGVPRAPFYEELARIVSDGRRPDPEEWAEFYRRHDHHIA